MATRFCWFSKFTHPKIKEHITHSFGYPGDFPEWVSGELLTAGVGPSVIVLTPFLGAFSRVHALVVQTRLLSSASKNEDDRNLGVANVPRCH